MNRYGRSGDRNSLNINATELPLSEVTVAIKEKFSVILESAITDHRE